MDFSNASAPNFGDCALQSKSWPPLDQTPQLHRMNRVSSVRTRDAGKLTKGRTMSYEQRSSMSARQREMYDRILRVDHAGELGADRIYAGQMAVLGKTDVGPVIQHMWDQEKHHLRTFEELIPRYRARPTVMMPFWNLAGFVLGAGSALVGKEAAMACTVAVEETITEHYNNQIRELMADDPRAHKELLDVISKFRDEEMEHHDTGLEHDAQRAPLYSASVEMVKLGCKAAIWISERI